MSERMWCTACGTVSADQICDCNRYGAGHEMYREPNFVNYADAMQEAAHEQAQHNNALVRALERIAGNEFLCPAAADFAKAVLGDVGSTREGS